MVHNFSQTPSLLSNYIAEIRDVSVQNDRMRFRRNMERIGEIIGYEISKQLPHVDKEVTTPLGTSTCKVLEVQPVLATILRAGLALHQGLLSYFDKGDNAFISAYRKHHKDGSFDIKVEYLSCPDLSGRILIVSDPMLATGSSMLLSLETLLQEGKPSEIHIVTAIAATEGIEHIRANMPDVTIWVGAIDEELTAKSYIVPGLGDAGDLAFGEKVQE